MIEKARPGDGQSDERFVVVLSSQEADAALDFYNNLRQGNIVDAKREALTFGPFHVGQTVGGDEAVVVVVAAEEIQFGVRVGGSQKVDASLDGGVPGALADGGVRIRVARHGSLVFVAARYQRGVAEMAVVGIAAEGKPTVIVGEVESANKDGAFGTEIARRLGVDSRGDVVVEAVAGIAAEAEAEAFDARPVDTRRGADAVGGAEFVGRGRAVVNPTSIVEEVAVERRQELQLIAPAAGLAPEAEARFVPSARHDSVFALRAIDAKEAVRSMVVVGHADRDDDVAGADVEMWAETFLDPELLEGDLAAALNLLLKLASFLGFLLDGSFHAPMLELDFGAHRPTAAEVIAQHDDSVRDIDAAKARRILVAVGVAVAEDIVAIEVMAIGSLAIAANNEVRFAQ